MMVTAQETKAEFLRSVRWTSPGRAVIAKMDAEQQTLRLPDDYAIESATDRDDRRLLALRRRDGSAVAIFEFSAIGPDPRRIWQIAWEDSEADPEIT